MLRVQLSVLFNVGCLRTRSSDTRIELDSVVQREFARQGSLPDCRKMAARENESTGHSPPEESDSELAIAGLFLALSFFYLCIFRRYCGVDPDEGIILQGAQRILAGQVLYRDFFSFFTPGSYYLFALIFRIFGNSYLVAHTSLAVIGALLSPITYLLARRVCSRQTSLLVTGLMIVTAVPWRFVIIHNWDSTLFACVALYCAVRFIECPSTPWLFAMATFTSGTALFEQSKGAGLFLGLSAGFLLIVFGNDAGGKDRKLFTREQMMAAAAGLCWPFLATAVYFAAHHALAEMLASWFWPLHHYSAANHVPYAYDNLTGQARDRIFAASSTGMRLFAMLVFSARTWIPYIPIVAIALLVRLTLRKWRPIAPGKDWAYYVLISAALSGLLLSIVIARADYLHFIYLQPISFLVIAWLLDGRGIRHPLFAKIAPVAGFCLSMSLIAMAAQTLFSARGSYSVATRRGEITMSRPDHVIPYVQARVAPGERIMIYPYNSTYYYLTGTYSPTGFDFYQPGMHTQEQLQEMLAEFSAHPTPVVLYEPEFNKHLLDAWPNTPPGALVRDALADFIQREYRVCASLGSPSQLQFLLMVRRDLICQ
jgi:hypothetical protein